MPALLAEVSGTLEPQLFAVMVDHPAALFAAGGTIEAIRPKEMV
jgi:hypothetical protein